MLEFAKSLFRGAEHMNNDGFKEVKSQNEISKLDREWEIEREKYMIVGAYGGRVIPDSLSSGLASIGILVFGISWVVLAISFSGFVGQGWANILPPIGLVFMVLGLFLSLRAFQKAGQDKAAYERYQRRREEILEQH